MTFNEILDTIEAKIVELENENRADPRIQQLLDIEGTLVLKEYYAYLENTTIQIPKYYAGHQPRIS